MFQYTVGTDKHRLTPFILGTWNGKIHRIRKVHWQMTWAGGWGEVMGLCLRHTGFPFRKVRNSRDGKW